MNTANCRIITARDTLEGADAFVHRLFPVPAQRQRSAFKHWDPFVLWDHFTLQGGSGFPFHPHRGFEGITYLINGSINHEDNLGNKSTVHAGGIQRFTAGKGIVHSEVPAATRKTTGIQLWLNLAKKNKQLPPSYQALDAKDVPSSSGKGWTIRQILVEQSPIQINTDANMRDLSLTAQTHYSHNIEHNHQGLAYLLQGHIRIDQQVLYPQQALLFANVQTLNISANNNARLIIATGLPHKEAIVQCGPFVD